MPLSLPGFGDEKGGDFPFLDLSPELPYRLARLSGSCFVRRVVYSRLARLGKISELSKVCELQKKNLSGLYSVHVTLTGRRAHLEVQSAISGLSWLHITVPTAAQ